MWAHEEEAKVAETVMRAKRAKVEKNRNSETDIDIQIALDDNDVPNTANTYANMG